MSGYSGGPGDAPWALLDDLVGREMLHDAEEARRRLRLGYPIWLAIEELGPERSVAVLSKATGVPMLEEPLSVEKVDIDVAGELDPGMLKGGRYAPLADGRVAVADPYRPLPEKLRDRKPCVAPGREIDEVLSVVFPGQEREGRDDRRIGRSLLDEGVITEKELAKALDEQEKSGGRLGDILASQGAIERFEEKPAFPRLRLAVQIAVAVLAPLLLPFLLYVLLYEVEIDVVPYTYIFIVVALCVTASLIWLEGFEALKPGKPPDEPRIPYPPASAIIVGYLPNEADTIVETIEAFLRVKYPAPLRIILAYNTPEDLPVEEELRAIARRDPRFLPLRTIKGSTSKAHNINVALAQVKGEFVGIFDADHHPAPDSFMRAWRWLAEPENHVVQGHNVIRNGNASWLTRVVAVEFETIYAISHPGRTRLHAFGIFGGSNGYWKTDLLRETKMRGNMLTEDIDSSARVIEAGYNIVTDPRLVSREFAPKNLKGLWNQRMRWAQGWFQVSLRHQRRGLRSPRLTFRQKLGFLHLFAWNVLVYPWLSLQAFPIVAFWIWRGDAIDWLVPIFVLTTIFALGVGPVQTLFTYLLAAPEIKKRKSWFLLYLLASTPFYPEFKNLIARVAQIKQLLGEEQKWKVTPRA